jgi:hypothetical protein
VRAGIRYASIVVGLGLALSGCVGRSSNGEGTAVVAGWVLWRHVPAVVDLTGPRGDGRLTVAAAGHLWLLGTAGEPAAFASGGDGYATDPAPEPYIALSTGATVAEAGCAFGRDEVYALEPGGNPGVVAVDADGRARRVADLPGVVPNGIAFDDVGRFGYRLLVTAATAGSGAMVYAMDCAGTVTVIASHAPTVEGGIVVAPASFGEFGGDLIAPDETSGQIWAIGPDGNPRVVARSGLPSGGDIGVESAGFVPADFTPDWAAYVADRRSAGNPHPGNDSILQLSGAMLTASDVRPGDLVVASEAGAQTVAVRCAATCTVRHIVDGPATAHVEGHLVFAPPR